MIHHFRGFQGRGIQLKCCFNDLRSSQSFIDTVNVWLGEPVINVIYESMKKYPGTILNKICSDKMLLCSFKCSISQHMTQMILFYIYGLACNPWFQQHVLHVLVIKTVIKTPGFTIAEGCTSGSSTVPFVPSCTCPMQSQCESMAQPS